MIPYQCQSCDRVRELPNQQTGCKRKMTVCHDCKELTAHERLNQDYSDMTDAQRDFLRSIHQEVRVPTNSQSQKSIHLDGGDSTLCKYDIDSRKIDVSSYPRGYLDWCQHCLERSKNNKEDVSERTETTEEACKRAMQIANEKADGEITKAKYEDIDIFPSIYSIKETFGSWSKAKEKFV